MACGAVLATGAVAASSPAVVTGKADHVTSSSALLHGTVNPNGSQTTYYFQWGLTTSYGVSGKALSAGHGTRSIAVQETAGSLIPGTVYHYRVVASNQYGTTVGKDGTFTTAGHPPPDVATGPATGISQGGATVTGVINPHSQQTTWTFQWGVSTSYTYSVNGGVVPASGSAQSVAYGLTGLAPGTIYHYRLVASHGTGNTTVVGADATFMTYPRHRPVPRIGTTVKPRRLRRQPFSVATLGTVGHPSWIPSQFACTGNVVVRYLSGHRTIGTSFVPLQSDCRYGSVITFAHRHQPLTVRVHFLGNGYLAPNTARAGTIRFG